MEKGAKKKNDIHTSFAEVGTIVEKRLHKLGMAEKSKGVCVACRLMRRGRKRAD